MADDEFDVPADYESEDEIHVNENEPAKEKKVQKRNKWRYDADFGSRDAALKYIEGQNTWTAIRTYTTKLGTKTLYRCNRV